MSLLFLTAGQTPYRVVVRAGTSQGFGDATSIVVFSGEGGEFTAYLLCAVIFIVLNKLHGCAPSHHAVPIKAVDSVTVEWTTVSSVLVTWTPLSYIEARGFPLYLITYMSDDSSTFGSTNTTSSSVAITGLDSQNVYIFAVQVSTGNGKNKGTEFGEQVRGLSDNIWKVWWPEVSTFEYLYNIDHYTCKKNYWLIGSVVWYIQPGLGNPSSQNGLVRPCRITGQGI